MRGRLGLLGEIEHRFQELSGVGTQDLGLGGIGLVQLLGRLVEGTAGLVRGGPRLACVLLACLPSSDHAALEIGRSLPSLLLGCRRSRRLGL